MILILTPNIDPESGNYRQLMAHLSRLQDITLRVHREVGTEKTLTEIYLIGNTSAIPVEDMKSLPGVERVVRVSEEYRVLGRHRDDHRSSVSDLPRGNAQLVQRLVAFCNLARHFIRLVRIGGGKRSFPLQVLIDFEALLQPFSGFLPMIDALAGYRS